MGASCYLDQGSGAVAAAAAAAPAVTPDRPSLESLLPRREPGANMPRTGAEAFLPPETSGATGPLFGKRSEPASTPAATSDAASSDAAADLIVAPLYWRLVVTGGRADDAWLDGLAATIAAALGARRG